MIGFIIFQLSKSKKLCNFIQNSKKLTSKFVAGTTLSQEIAVVKQLNKKGIKATIDFLGENVSNKKQVKKAINTYLTILKRININKLNAQISLKLSQIGINLDEKLCLNSLKKIVKTAKKYKNIVEIDMEDFSLVDKTINIFQNIQKEYKNIAICLQANLYRTEDDLKNLLKTNSSIRLVKGGYKERKEIAFSKKKDVDKNYLKLLKKILKNNSKSYIATHDKKIIKKVLTISHNHPKIEFEMLYGVNKKVQELLAKENLVRIYVPYGNQWCPYLMRRMAERPANLFFVIKKIFYSI